MAALATTVALVSFAAADEPASPPHPSDPALASGASADSAVSGASGASAVSGVSGASGASAVSGVSGASGASAVGVSPAPTPAPATPNVPTDSEGSGRHVRVGADQLDAPIVRAALAGKRLGVLAHVASRLSDGTHVVDALRARYDLRAIFAPEHGFRSVPGGGVVDAPVGDSTDPVTGLPVFSLYGPRRAPSADELKLIDVLVIDLQDVAVRFYTYPATMAWAIEAAAAAGKPVVVLDRPDVAARFDQGVLLETEWQGSITSLFPVTTMHGMTMGELAQYFVGEMLGRKHAREGEKDGGRRVDLTVVPVQGYSRAMTWAETGLPWTAPSPALVTPEQALLYVAFGPFESLNLAVGRSLDNADAFHVFGAPWITAEVRARLVGRLIRLGLPGLEFSETEWVPDRREYKGELCRGFRVRIRDEKRLAPFADLVAVFSVMHDELPGLTAAGLDKPLGRRWVREGIEGGMTLEAVIARARTEDAAFFAVRSRYLLY